MSEATHCDELTLPRETQSQCGSKGCRESLPYWITDILDITFQAWVQKVAKSGASVQGCFQKGLTIKAIELNLWTAANAATGLTSF